MSTTYRFSVQPCGADLQLEHNLLMPNTWTDKAGSGNLVVGSGNVDASQAGRLICHSGPPDNSPVLTLLGASWDSKVGDRGNATCDMCNGTPDAQSWTVTSKA